jgi:hypothetical protein
MAARATPLGDPRAPLSSQKRQAGRGDRTHLHDQRILGDRSVLAGRRIETARFIRIANVTRSNRHQREQESPHRRRKRATLVPPQFRALAPPPLRTVASTSNRLRRL